MDDTSSEEAAFDFDPYNLPPKYLHAIGLMATAASHTEWVTQELIGGLLGIGMVETRALTAHMTAPLRDHIARALVELRASDAEHIDDLDDLLDAVDTALNLRNTALHNSLIIERKTGPGVQLPRVGAR